MTRSAFLRVYQPLDVFPERARQHWLLASDEPTGDGDFSLRWLISSSLPPPDHPSASETPFIRRCGEEVFVCPQHTRLRMLIGLLSFRDTVPLQVADAFVSENEAQLAARELAELDEHPSARSHILQANWHVPLRWFAAFQDRERSLIEDRDGLRIRYETRLAKATQRLGTVLAVLSAADVDDSLKSAVSDLLGWLEGFPGSSILELDYGSVARMFSDEDLLEDHSAAMVETSLRALAEGDAGKAERSFSELLSRWGQVRVLEVAN